MVLSTSKSYSPDSTFFFAPWKKRWGGSGLAKRDLFSLQYIQKQSNWKLLFWMET